MGLVLLEGLDRTGKSTVAAYFETLGFEVIHMSAPKGVTADQYMQDMADLLSSAATKDIVLDRTHYGELVWPAVYGTPNKPRTPLLSEEDIEILREIEESVGVQRIWMTDDDLKAHWQRCVDNKEPLDRAQFTRARALFSDVAQKYGFEKVTLQNFVKKFPDAQAIVDGQTAATLEAKTLQAPAEEVKTEATPAKASKSGKSAEQHKLEVANIINDVLSKRILKGRGNVYDDLENELRAFLNTKLGKLLGGASATEATLLSREEVLFYKEMFKRAMNKGVN